MKPLKNGTIPVCIHFSEELFQKIIIVQKQCGSTFPVTIKMLIEMGLEHRKERV
jgi:hypothetical protein